MYNQAQNNYIDILEGDYDLNVDDEYIKMARFYQSLSEQNKNHIRFLIRTILDDSICNFLSWIDGIYYVSNQDGDIDFYIGGKKVNIFTQLSDTWKCMQDEGLSEAELKDEIINRQLKTPNKLKN